jgi:hypothetical protein
MQRPVTLPLVTKSKSRLRNVPSILVRGHCARKRYIVKADGTPSEEVAVERETTF